VLVEFNDNQKSLLVSSERVANFVEAALNFLNVHTDHITVNFVSKKRIQEIHLALFNDPTVTDCITQPFDSYKIKKEGHFLGEVFICPLVAKTYARQHDIDPYEELSLYLAHTLLHLCGLDDISEEDAHKMRLAEKKLLTHLKDKNLLLECQR
jgi:probable rRNA maturation factor